MAKRNKKQSNEATPLSKRPVKYFHGVNADGSFPLLDMLNIGYDELTPLLIEQTTGHVLNPMVDAEAFVPSHYLFKSSHSEVSGVFIPANDGVYWNSCVPDDSGKFTNWKKLKKPAGAANANFADWIIEDREDDGTITLHALKSNDQNLDICKTVLTKETRFLVNGDDDQRNVIDCGLFDLNDASKSFYLTTNGKILTNDRSEWTGTSSYVSSLAANKFDRVSLVSSDNNRYEFYCAMLNEPIDRSEDAANCIVGCDAGLDPLTAEYGRLDILNPIACLSSTYCFSEYDFFDNLNTSLRYNPDCMTKMWKSVENVNVLFGIDGQPISALSDIYDSLIGIESCDVSCVLASNPDGTLNPTYELCHTDDAGDVMAKWFISSLVTSKEFELRGIFNGPDNVKYAIGNVLSDTAGAKWTIMFKIPNDRQVEPYEYGDGLFGYRININVTSPSAYYLIQCETIGCIQFSYQKDETIEEEYIAIAKRIPSSESQEIEVDILKRLATTGDYDFSNIYHVKSAGYGELRDMFFLHHHDLYVVSRDINGKTMLSYCNMKTISDSSETYDIAPTVVETHNQALDSYSINNIIADPSTPSVLVDFTYGTARALAVLNTVTKECALPLAKPAETTTTPSKTIYDYAKAFDFAVDDASLIFHDMTHTPVEILGSSQLSASYARGVLSTDVYRFNFDGAYELKRCSEYRFDNKNFIAASFTPSAYETVIGSNLSTDVPDLPYAKDNFGLSSFAGSDSKITGVVVKSMSDIIDLHGCFYATIADIDSFTLSDPTFNDEDNKYHWTSNINTVNERYALISCSFESGSIVEVNSILKGEESFAEIVGPDSWSFTDSEDKRPNVLVFADGSMKKTILQVFDNDNWEYSGTIPGLGQNKDIYAAFDDSKAVTVDKDGNICRIDVRNHTLDCIVSNTSELIGYGEILGIQNYNNDTLYVFVSYPNVRRNSEIDITIYRGDYTTMSSTWNLALFMTAESIDLLPDGSIYVTTDPDTGHNMLYYSSANGGINKVSTKNGYNIVYDVLEQTDCLPADGTILKTTDDGGILVTGDNKLSSLIIDDDIIRNTCISANIDSVCNVFMNFATSDMSSYMVLDAHRHPSIIELSSNGDVTIKSIIDSNKTIYDVSALTYSESYRQVNFHGATGRIYQLSTTVQPTTNTTPYETYNGKSLLSNMTYGFPGKDEQLSDYAGALQEMHVASFNILSNSNDSIDIFIDNLYNTTELSDDFDQTYWIAAVQLDNRTSSKNADGEIQWAHHTQRYKLSELYNKPFRFADIRNGGTVSAETILTAPDGCTVYKAVPRTDWDRTHLRKIVREQGHLDNACDALRLNPDFTTALTDIQTSPYGGAIMLQPGYGTAFYTNWRHDIKYFGTCIEPYTMFNSRIQDSYVTAISKYGDDDLNFVLGTSQGFIHLINGHLFAKGMMADLDGVSHVLSGNCTYAGRHLIDNGTSTENRFLFADNRSLFNLSEHNFEAKCEIDRTFELTRETINDIFRIGDGAYVICTSRGIYVSHPKLIIKDYLDDYTLSDLNNAVDRQFSTLLASHEKSRHFTGSTMDLINHKIDRNFNPYPSDFTRVSPVITSRHVLDVDNDLVESIEVRLTDEQASSNASNVFAAIKSETITNAFTATRSYAPAGWYDRVVDINDENHIVDYSDIRYICRRWRSGIVEFYIFIPTTFTYYYNNLTGYSQSPYAGMSINRPNVSNIQVVNGVNSLHTDLRIFISNTMYNLNTIYMAQIVGNSLPLKIYKDSTYCDSNRAGFFDTLIQPSVVRSLPVMTGRSKNNVNPLMNASNQICLDFAVYGTDAQAIHILAR